MPLYEYRCRQCDARFELLQSSGAGSSAVRCPECDAKAVERVLSTFATAAGGRSAAASAGCGSGFT
jgi:putative FmdB family regulatory protein